MGYFTKWPEAYYPPNYEAETAAEVLVSLCFIQFSGLAELQSDQGREFQSQVFCECCELVGMQKIRTTPLRPQSKGMIERFNLTFTQQLAKYCPKAQQG